MIKDLPCVELLTASHQSAFCTGQLLCQSLFSFANRTVRATNNATGAQYWLAGLHCRFAVLKLNKFVVVWVNKIDDADRPPPVISLICSRQTFVVKVVGVQLRRKKIHPIRLRLDKWKINCPCCCAWLREFNLPLSTCSSDRVS